MPAPRKKVCNRCKTDKLLDDFYHNKTKPDYHNDICKVLQAQVNAKMGGTPRWQS